MSTLKVDTIKDTSGVEVYTAKAWVNFNGTFGTSPFTEANGGIRGAGNVSSVTDIGNGQYRVYFTNALPDGNYSVTFGFEPDGLYFSGSAATRVVNIAGQNADNLVVYSGYQAAGGSSYYDFPVINITVFR